MLSLEGALDLSVDGAAAHLEARGDTLRLDVEHPRAFLRAGGGAPRIGDRMAAVRALARHLFERGLTLRVVSRGRPLLTLGRGARPGITARLLGVPHLALGRGGDLLRALAG